MNRRRADLSTQLLVRFLAAVSQCPDAAAAALVGAESAAAAFEAEVGTVLVNGIFSAVGFPKNKIPEEELLAVVRRQVGHVNVPGAGECETIAVALDEHAKDYLILARSGDGFTAEESNLLRGMARTLELVLVMLTTLEGERAMREQADRHAAENAELLASLGQRHTLLKQLITIQRAISSREPLARVLGLIVAGAHELLQCDVANLFLADAGVPSTLQLAQSSAVMQQGGSTVWTAHAAPAEIGARAMALAGVVVGPAAMAAPVSNHNRVVGALVVGSASQAFAYTEAQQATLVAFAEHVSLALSDASTLEDMREANHDALTGLASRRLFMERLQQSVAHAAHIGATVAILFLDLDRFKMVNDVLGHAAGDLLLSEVARRLRVCLRGGDSAARLGGDEFAVLLPAITDPHQALAVAERILTALRAPVIIDGRELFIEASIGVASGVCAEDDDGETILRDADVAMYEAKRSGADRAVVFQSRMRGEFQARVQAQAHAGLGRRPGSTAFLA